MPEKQFSTFTTEAIVLDQKDVDTDLIIPASFLKTTKITGLGDFLFFHLKKSQPHIFPANGRRCLIAGKNFGCGSSREHAVWAIKEAGIDCVIASDFADIFRGNAEKNGLLLIEFPEGKVQSLMKEYQQITIDLENQKITDAKGEKYPFEISAFTKKRILHDISDIDLLLQHREKILAFNENTK